MKMHNVVLHTHKISAESLCVLKEKFYLTNWKCKKEKKQIVFQNRLHRLGKSPKSKLILVKLHGQETTHT